MGLGKWKSFLGYQRIYSSEAFNDTMRAVDHLARETMLLLDGKSEDERREILAKAQRLTEQLTDIAALEQPMVGALGLLTAVRVYEQLIQQQANNRKP